MLKAASEKDRDFLLKVLSSGIISLRISAYITAYGLDRDFFKIWLDFDSENPTVIALFENAILLKLGDNESEVKSFLSFLPFESITMNLNDAERLGYKETEIKTAYKFKETKGKYTALDVSEDDLEEAYKLISKNIPGSFSDSREEYLFFRSDFVFRSSRGLLRGKCIKENEKLISCAFTAAETESKSLLSGIACDSKSQKKGLGKRTVLALTEELLKKGKDVFVIALNKSAEGFYEHIGFCEEEKISYIERKKDV